MASTKRKSADGELADDAVRSEWLRRIEAEYRSAALTQHLTLWLIQLAAPPELIAAGLRVVADELAHSELSAEVYQAAGGTRGPALARESLSLRRTQGESLERDLLRVAVEQFCLGETIAVRLFQRMRKGARVGSARRALDRIVRDEVVHRDFGWSLLEWLLTTPMAAQFHAQLVHELPAMLARVRQNYGALLLDKLGTNELEVYDRRIGQAARAWGLMATSDYLEIVAETFTRDYEPRFRALGISSQT